MRLLTWLRARLSGSLRRTPTDGELDEELQYHLDREIAEARRAGLSQDEARRAALVAMGAVQQNKEASRELRPGRLFRELGADLRYAARMLRRQPGFSLLAVGILALGIGANTAVFSVVSAVLLEPLPYPAADRIVSLRAAFLRTGTSQSLVSLANFNDWRDQNSTFDAMTAYGGGDVPVTAGAAAEYVRTARVDAQFFPVFAVPPAQGRAFTEADSADNAQVAIVSDAYWRSRLESDRGVLGRTLRVGNNARAIVGVMPAGFRFPADADVWLPRTSRTASRTAHNLLAAGRLKPRISLDRAQADLRAIAARLEQQYPEANQGRGVLALRLQDDIVGELRLTLYLLWGVVGVILLIACANTATLLLGKATTRTREIAVRTALGADRRRIIRQLVTESLLLSCLAGTAGTLLAVWGARVLVALTPSDAIQRAQPDIDGGVLAFTLLVSLATSLLCGLVPALHASKVNLTDAFRGSGNRSGTSGRAVRTRGWLVAVEIALAVVLLTGAGLLVKSLIALHRVDLGYQPANVLVARATGVLAQADNDAYFDRVLARIRTVAGVLDVGATSIPPGDLTLFGSGAYFVDRMPDQRDRTREPLAFFTIAAPGTFAALGIPIRSGRDFQASDSREAPLVAVVNDALVRKSFDGADPLGRKIVCTFDRKEPMTIVGVVGDVHQNNPAVEPIPECYMPYMQHAYNGNTLHIVIRTATDPAGLEGTIRAAAAEISPEVPIAFSTMEAKLQKGLADPTFRTLLFVVFAGLAVGLAMAGVYGVMAFTADQRSQEIGLRMALGATRTSVIRLILGQSLTLAGAGILVGLVAASFAARFLATVLFDVRPFDPQVYVVVATLIALVALAAALLPARRASGVDPMRVLNSD